MNTSRPNLLCFIDIETTGHDPLKYINGELLMWHEIIDFAAIFVNQKSLYIDSKISLLVKPEHPERCLPDLINHYPSRAAQGEWNQAWPLSKLLLHFLALCDNKKVICIGQNFFFDWSFMNVGFAKCGISEPELRRAIHYSKLDIRSMAVQALLKTSEEYDPDEFSLRNGSLSKRLGISPEPVPHTALNGANQAYQVYKKLNELRRV